MIRIEDIKVGTKVKRESPYADTKFIIISTNCWASIGNVSSYSVCLKHEDEYKDTIYVYDVNHFINKFNLCED